MARTMCKFGPQLLSLCELFAEESRCHSKMIVAFMALKVSFNRMIPSFIKFRAPRVDGMLPAMQTNTVYLFEQ